MSCRAPYQPEENYEPIRLPNMGPNANLIGEIPLRDYTQRYTNTYPGNSGFPQQQQQQQSQQLQQQQMQQHVVAAQQTQHGNLANMTNTSGHTKLSADANEFVPNFTASSSGNSGGLQNRLDRQQQHYQQPYFVQQQQQQHQQPQQQQQRYYNGYQHQKDHHGQQQQYQQYNNSASVGQLSNSVQERLRITGGGGGGGGGHKQHHQGAIGGSNHQGAGSSGNYYQHQQQSHHSNKHFQKHPHLNHYQQHQQRGHHQHNQHHHQQQQQQHHHQQHHHQHNDYYSNSSGAGASASSANSSTSTTTTSTTDTSSSSHPDMETIALEYLDTVIHCLNQNPGQFDAIAPRFLTIFEGMENNNYVLSIAMEDIFEKSIENPNFRYMGAKLYNLLHMMNPKKDSLFHTLLKCKLDFHQEEVSRFIESNQQHKVRETALFLAELYMQLRGDDSRIHLIAVNIVYSLKQLLAKENNENVRCICLTLKLAGYDLTADCPDDMKDIIAKLDMINVSSPGKYPLADNVITLQKNNWGRKVSNSLGEGDSVKPPEPLRLSDEPVFYGPDGRELTAEETDFLAEDGANGDDDDDVDLDDDDDDDDGGELDPEMDEETERAYKDFRKQQKAQLAAAASSSKS